MKRRGFTYKIMDLEYPAVSVSVPNLTGVGAFISAGKSFKFGRSVQTGVGSLVAYRSMVQMNCPDTRWILMGYSQGAMVVAQALKYFKVGELVYAGMFGDPELYLPEGRGAWPAACRGKNLSPYRVFVPNCHADNGSLGTRKPYEIDRFRGKYGLWCNNGDFVCGSSKNLFNNGGHVEYRNGAYLQAFAIVDKILTTNRVSTNSVRLMREAPSEIYAYARQTEYFVAPGEEIEIDLTPSISIEHEVSEYLWSFDGETWMANDAVILRSFEAGEYKILAKVSDGFNESDVLEILVHVGNFAGPVTLPAPTTLKLLRQDDNIRLYWRAAPDGAKYAFIKVNGLGLDYVDASAGETRISDVEYDDLRDIEVAWMDADGNVGEFATIDMANFGSEITLGD